MRRAQWLLVGGFAGAVVAFAACGGSSTETPPADAGTDTGPVDTGAPDLGVDTGPTCDVDANLNTMNPADAEVGEGGSVGLCVACSRAKCTQELSDCQSDCQCVGDFSDLYSCLGSGKSIFECGQGLFQGADTQEQALAQCVFTTCQDECGLHFNLDAGGGGGDASDAGSDAPHDAGNDG